MRTCLFAFATVVLLGCSKSNDSKESPPPAGGTATPVPAAAPTPSPPVPAAPPAPVPDVQACSVLAAATVGTIFGKPVVSSGSGLHCTYGIDPAVKQKQMDALKGDMGAMTKKGFAIPAAISEQLSVDVDLSHDTDTEDHVKAIYANIGKTVNDTVKPEEHGLDKTIQVAAKDLPNVGDWAFSTNVASVNMGMGISTRGRLLEARQGTWRLTISATVAPDPGEAKMDTQLGDVARGVFAKLK